MQLTMTVLRCPDSVAPETRNITGGEFTVGRGPGVDWVLPDPERLLSKRHFAVAFRGGSWQLADTSTNGTYLNRENDPIGAGDLRSLHDGDRVRVGAYEIEMRLVEDDDARPGGAVGDSPFADPFAMDPFGPARPQRNPFDEPDHLRPRNPPTSAQLPHDFDPLAPDTHETPFHGPTQADNSPVMQDAFRPPAHVGQLPLHAGGTIPGDDLLPDDWDKDLLEGISPAGPAPAPVPPPRPVAPPPPQRKAAPKAAPPVDRTRRTGRRTATSGCRPARRAPAPDGARNGGRRRCAARGIPRGRRPAGCAPRGSARDDARVGQGVPQPGRRPARGADRPRADQERIPHRADDDPGARQQSAEILRRRRRRAGRAARHRTPHRHGAARGGGGCAARHPAARARFDGGDADGGARAARRALDPAKLRAQAEQGGGMSLLPAQKKARAWDAFEALHARTVQALADDFDSVFGKAFARAYERSLHEVASRERE